MRFLTLFAAVSTMLFHQQGFAQWELKPVAWGTKPALALDSEGTPHIGYIYEIPTGWVRLAEWDPATMTFDTSDVNTGNFYGPAAIAIDQNDQPALNYHRHSPVPEQMYSIRSGGVWTHTPIESDNHDGWDNSIQFDSNNLPHTSTIDPSNFGPTSTGVEYAVFDGANWTVEAIGSELINYFTATSLELDSNDDPHITYYDDLTDDLMYAVRSGGIWSITAVETAGDVGRFASLELDDSDSPSIAYYEHLADSMGLVKYAKWNGSAWDIEVIDTLHRVYLDLARTTISLDLDDSGTPHVSYGDEKRISYATMDGTTWQTEIIVDVNGTDTLLGQVTSLAVDAFGTVHVAYYELFTRSPLTGYIMLATRTAGGSTIPCDAFTNIVAKCQRNGSILFRVNLLNSSQYAGEQITCSVDGDILVGTIVTNGTHSRASFNAPGPYAPGDHTITLVDPAGCLDPKIVNCREAENAEWAEAEILWNNSGAGDEGRLVPAETRLIGNYPNPFNPSTLIRYTLANDSFVSLKVYDAIGREVATLVEGFMNAGDQSVTWDGKTTGGVQVSSGIYFYRLVADGIILTNRMILSK